MKPARSKDAGFSLIEVMIALGIVAYMISAVMGLLPSGMKAFRDADERGEASGVVNAVAESIRASVRDTNDPSKFTWCFNGSSNSFTVGGAAVVTGWNALTLETGAAANLPRLNVAVRLTPPATQTGEGTAVITAAWPTNATLSWSGSDPVWSRGAGSLTLSIRFLTGS